MVSNEVDTSDMSWPCLCRYSYAPVFAECDTGSVFTASSTQTHARGTGVTTDKHKGIMGGKDHTGHKRHTGIDRRHWPALHSAFNGTAHTHTDKHKGGKHPTGHKRHTGIDRRRGPALHSAFNGTAHTHTHRARANRIDSSIGTDSFAGIGSLRASPRRGHNGTHHRINPRHPRHNAGARLCRRPCQPVVEPLYKRLCQYAGAPAQMPGTPLSLSYTLHEKDDAAHPMDNTTKQMCAAARQMGAAARQMCAAASQMCAAARQMCATARQMCATARQMCAAAGQMCAAAGPMCAAAGPMCATARPMHATAGPMCATAKASQDLRRRSAGAECGEGA